MVDLTRDADGRLHARLLDVAPTGQGPPTPAALGSQQTTEFIDAVEHAALVPGHMGSATSRTTAYASCSSPTDHAATGDRPILLNDR